MPLHVFSSNKFLLAELSQTQEKYLKAKKELDEAIAEMAGF
jgi:hypothetical protein